MKTPPMGHPDGEQLLRYADGEAPAATASEIRAHLEACWQCRTEMEDLQKTVGECVRYRKSVLERHLPPPPAPWRDIYRGFAEIDAALDQGSFLVRAARILRAPGRSAGRWAPLAAALLILCVLYFRFRQAPSVQAAELLRKAIAAADGRPDRPRKLQIRTRDRRLTRLAGAEKKLASNLPDSDALSSIQALFRAADYDWEDPLSARSYQAWRDRLADKRDEVTEEPDAYRIRTNTGTGELTEVTLKIRMQDLRPVAERFEFRNREWVEITELSDDASPAGVIASSGGASAGAHASAARRIQPDRSLSRFDGPATASDELHVLVALREVGADLGDPIEVSRAGGEILVNGVGVAPERQQQIHDALRSQRHIVVRFSDSPPERIEAEKEPSANRVTQTEVRQAQTPLAEQIGRRVDFTRLATQVLDLSEPMMSRVYALRRLAEQISIQTEAELSVQDRQLLRRLQQEHTEALRRQLDEIDRALKPALPSESFTVTPAITTSSGAWQPATEELFQSARRVEKLLAVIFGAAMGEAPGEQLPSQLLSSLAELRARLEAYDRLSEQALQRRK